MKLRTNMYDLWVFHNCNESPEYLIYHTSLEKANKWFFGKQFWQVPGGFVSENQDVIDAIKMNITEKELSVMKIWAVEYTYTYYNARRKNIEIVPVFAAEVEGPGVMHLSWEHSEFGWFNSKDCLERV